MLAATHTRDSRPVELPRLLWHGERERERETDARTQGYLSEFLASLLAILQVSRILPSFLWALLSTERLHESVPASEVSPVSRHMDSRSPCSARSFVSSHERWLWNFSSIPLEKEEKFSIDNIYLRYTPLSATEDISVFMRVYGVRERPYGPRLKICDTLELYPKKSRGMREEASTYPGGRATSSPTRDMLSTVICIV